MATRQNDLQTRWPRRSRRGLLPTPVPVHVSSATVAVAELRLPRRLGLLDELGVAYTCGDGPVLSWPATEELTGLATEWHDVAGVRVFARCLDGGIQRRDGAIHLPFDPDEALLNLRREAYVREGLRSAARRAYYRARPLLPRPLQIALRRSFTHVQG